MQIKGLFAVKSLNELRDMKGEAHKAALAIIDKAKAENRNLTDEELKNYDEYNRQIDELNVEIEQAIKLEEKRKNEAAAYLHSMERRNERKELERFSLQKYLREAVSGNISGFEREMQQEAVLEARDAGVALQGFGIPRKVARIPSKRDVSATATEGGDTIATDVTGYIDALWEYLVFDRMGVDKWTDLKGNVSIPKVTTKATAAMKATRNAAATETSPVYDGIAIEPHVLAATIDLDKQLILQSSIAIEQKLKEMLVKAVAYKYEYDAINTDTYWTSILTALTSNTVAMGTHGGAPTWAAITKLEGQVDASNALFGKLAYLGSAKGGAALRAVSKDTGSGQFLLENTYDYINKSVMSIANGYPFYTSPAVLNNVTKGTATSCTTLVFGNWSDCVVATWGPAYDLIVNPYTKSKEGMVELTIHVFCDFLVKQEASFAKIVDLRTT